MTLTLSNRAGVPPYAARGVETAKADEGRGGRTSSHPGKGLGNDEYEVAPATPKREAAKTR